MILFSDWFTVWKGVYGTGLLQSLLHPSIPVGPTVILPHSPSSPPPFSSTLPNSVYFLVCFFWQSFSNYVLCISYSGGLLSREIKKNFSFILDAIPLYMSKLHCLLYCPYFIVKLHLVYYRLKSPNSPHLHLLVLHFFPFMYNIWLNILSYAMICNGH